MFQPFNDWPPPPRYDPPRRPPMSDKDERRLVTAVCLFLLAVFLAPIAGGSLFEAVRVVMGG
jgi:hypothetical protein